MAEVQAALLAFDARAQTVRIDASHDDADGVVLPGETIRVTILNARPRATLGFTWLAHVEGDVLVSPNLGESGAWASPFIPPPGTLWTVNPGTPSGASLRGFALGFPIHPTFLIHFPVQWVLEVVDLISFDWTAPSVASPTMFAFTWDPSPSHPDISIYDLQNLNPYPIPTAYTAASITVLPAPAALVVVAAVLLPRRRR